MVPPGLALPKTMNGKAYGRSKSLRDLANLLEKIDAIPIKVRRMDLPFVRELAVRWWNTDRYNGEWKNKKRAALTSSNDLLDRVTVNYIRHRFTKYEKLVKPLTGKPGQITASRRLRARVLAEIAETYPELSEECKRQESYRHANDVQRIKCWKIQA